MCGVLDSHQANGPGGAVHLLLSEMPAELNLEHRGTCSETDSFGSGIRAHATETQKHRKLRDYFGELHPLPIDRDDAVAVAVDKEKKKSSIRAGPFVALRGLRCLCGSVSLWHAHGCLRLPDPSHGRTNPA